MNKELAAAILGGAVSLAGILLVFSGFLFSQAVSFPAETPDSVTDRYKTVAKHAVWPFLGCLVVTLVSGFALRRSDSGLLDWAWHGFLALVIGTGLYGTYVILGHLSKD